jgi:carbon monoxide dehydrogenase subunit G
LELEQTFEIPSSADRVWRRFNDIEGVVDCLPGASLRAPPDGGKLQLSMAVKLGPITANFVGDGEVHLDDAKRSGTVSGSATDRKSGSRIKGQVAFALSERSEGATPFKPLTRVTLAIDYTIGGTLAQYSREGIVRDLARRLTDTFAANLRDRLEAADGATDPTAPASGFLTQCESPRAEMPLDKVSTPDPAALPPPTVALLVDRRRPAHAAPLNVGALLWAAVKERVWRLFHRRPQA